MAKARPVRVDPDAPFEQAARRTLAVRGPELLEFCDGTLAGEDIEELHSMRVATRRLRAVLEVYADCFPKRRQQRLLSLVKDTADALGEARDLDVFIELLERHCRAVAKPDQPGVQSLIAMLRHRRAAADEHLAPALARLDEEKFDRQVARLAGEASS